jgi:hypothetical protein
MCMCVCVCVCVCALCASWRYHTLRVHKSNVKLSYFSVPRFANSDCFLTTVHNLLLHFNAQHLEWAWRLLLQECEDGDWIYLNQERFQWWDTDDASEPWEFHKIGGLIV